MAVSRINELIAAKADFVFETTLSSEHSIKVMERAKEAGFHVNMIFVCLDTAERNVERVRFRVADGGHDIPKDTIIRRYEAAFEKLFRALLVVDEAVLIDNSRKKPVMVASLSVAFWRQIAPNQLRRFRASRQTARNCRGRRGKPVNAVVGRESSGFQACFRIQGKKHEVAGIEEWRCPISFEARNDQAILAAHKQDSSRPGHSIGENHR